MRSKYSGRAGFTIVELLIVIVVIAILATLTSIAYFGVQNNAKTSGAKANAYSVQKIAEAFYADKNRLPTKVSDFSLNPLAKLPNGVNLLTFGQPLSDDNGSDSIDYEYIGTVNNATGARVLYWDFAKGQTGRPIIYIGNTQGASESSSDWKDLQPNS